MGISTSFFRDVKGVLRMPGVIFYDLCQQTAPSSSSSSKLTSTSEELSVEQHLVFKPALDEESPFAVFPLPKLIPCQESIIIACLLRRRENLPWSSELLEEPTATDTVDRNQNINHETTTKEANHMCNDVTSPRVWRNLWTEPSTQPTHKHPHTRPSLERANFTDSCVTTRRRRRLPAGIAEIETTVVPFQRNFARLPDCGLPKSISMFCVVQRQTSADCSSGLSGSARADYGGQGRGAGKKQYRNRNDIATWRMHDPLRQRERNPESMCTLSGSWRSRCPEEPLRGLKHMCEIATGLVWFCCCCCYYHQEGI